MNIKFEKRKLSLALRRDGKEYVFKRPSLNEFGEPSDDGDCVEITLTGIYHESRGYVSKKTNEATQINSKKQPMILCDFEKANELIKENDSVEISGVSYKVNKVEDVSHLGVYADISLEEC